MTESMKKKNPNSVVRVGEIVPQKKIRMAKQIQKIAPSRIASPTKTTTPMAISKNKNTNLKGKIARTPFKKFGQMKKLNTKFGE